MAHKEALPPVVPQGLGEDEHFEAAHHAAASALPMEAPPLVDDDLRHAAEAVWEQRHSLAAARSRNLEVIQELKERWEPVTRLLRASRKRPGAHPNPP